MPPLNNRLQSFFCKHTPHPPPPPLPSIPPLEMIKWRAQQTLGRKTHKHRYSSSCGMPALHEFFAGRTFWAKGSDLTSGQDSTASTARRRQVQKSAVVEILPRSDKMAVVINRQILVSFQTQTWGKQVRDGVKEGPMGFPEHLVNWIELKRMRLTS